MALLVPDVGEEFALQYLINKAVPQDLKLKLFQSNTTPAEADVAGTYTEATFTGYAAIVLTGASWTTVQGAPTQASYAQQSFTSSALQALQNIYGYYLIRTTGGELIYAERFSDGPYAISNLGDIIKVTPKITAD